MDLTNILLLPPPSLPDAVRGFFFLPKAKHQQHFPCLSSHLLHILPGWLSLASSPVLQPCVMRYPTASPADHPQAGAFAAVQTQGDLPVAHQRGKQPWGTPLLARDHGNLERCGASSAALGCLGPVSPFAHLYRCRSIDRKHKLVSSVWIQSCPPTHRFCFALRWMENSSSKFTITFPAKNNGSLIYFLLS